MTPKNLLYLAMTEATKSKRMSVGLIPSLLVESLQFSIPGAAPFIISAYNTHKRKTCYTHYYASVVTIKENYYWTKWLEWRIKKIPSFLPRHSFRHFDLLSCVFSSLSVCFGCVALYCVVLCCIVLIRHTIS
jgi:hypothetical protein